MVFKSKDDNFEQHILTPEEAAEMLKAQGFATKIYFGRGEGCRCGCLGQYWRPEDKMFNAQLKKVIKILESGKADDEEITLTESLGAIKGQKWIDFAYEGYRPLTVYCQGYKDS